jgi:hypothetical protein
MFIAKARNITIDVVYTHYRGERVYFHLEWLGYKKKREEAARAAAAFLTFLKKR